MRIVSGHQPAYLPWLGLLHKVALADVFVFMDDVQYLTQDWNNRNKIKGPQGAFWLTAPVRKETAGGALKDVRIVDDGWGGRRHWQMEHWRSLESCYRKAPYWDAHAAFFEQLYVQRAWRYLAELNETILRYLMEAFDLAPQWVRGSECGFVGRKSDLVLEHCRRFDADACVLGALGREYLVEGDFLAAGVSVMYQDYRHPTYPQRFGEFCSHLSAVDLLLNCGPQSREILFDGNVTRADIECATQRGDGPRVLTFAPAEASA